MELNGVKYLAKLDEGAVSFQVTFITSKRIRACFYFSYIPQIVVFFGTLLENIVSSVLDGHKKRRRSIRKH